jgi:hypothetical protein
MRKKPEETARRTTLMMVIAIAVKVHRIRPPVVGFDILPHSQVLRSDSAHLFSSRSISPLRNLDLLAGHHIVDWISIYLTSLGTKHHKTGRLPKIRTATLILLCSTKVSGESALTRPRTQDRVFSRSGEAWRPHGIPYAMRSRHARTGILASSLTTATSHASKCSFGAPAVARRYITEGKVVSPKECQERVLKQAIDPARQPQMHLPPLVSALCRFRLLSLEK